MSSFGKKHNIYQNYQRNLISATVSTNFGVNNEQRLVKIYGEGVSRVDLLNKLKIQSKFTFYWFLVFTVLGLICLILDPANWFNVLDLYVVMFNIYLIARGKVIGLVIGIIECVLYSVICFQSQLFGEIIKVMLISVPLNAVSIINWVRAAKRQKKIKYVDEAKRDDTDSVKRLSKKGILLYLLISVGVFGLSFVFLRFVLGQKNALILGSFSLMMTIIGKILIAQKYVDTWITFVVADFICLAMWTETLITSNFEFSNITMIVYYLACLSNDGFAFLTWKSMYRKITVNGPVFISKGAKRVNKIHKLKRMYRVMKWNKGVDISRSLQRKNKNSKQTTQLDNGE